MDSVMEELLTTLAKILIAIYKEGGETTKTKLRKEIGSAIYYSMLKGIELDLIVIEGTKVKLTQKGKEYAERLSKCV